ncbi:pectate lyase-like [Impatiens glandulifera]|uniref:pectate lyase-like n=1 Tax=Impatiens glandulifera TaxID=253017 RepID=UPI001FB13BB0|nr:pectate lyase-like [Impatiens glandulifera]
MENNYKILLLIFLLALNISTSTSNDEAEEPDVDKTIELSHDAYWEQKAFEAHEVAVNSYITNPFDVADNFNKKVGEVIWGRNGTRRGLKRVRGSCVATNPIDRCWRCRSDWASNRMRLADCAQGFGRHTTGGKGGKIYVVTDPTDHDLVKPKPGTLRHAVIQTEPLWIIFARSMVIRLQQELIMASHKTIDARGTNVHIANGAGITIQYVQNVIIHGLHIHDIYSGQGGLIRDSVGHYGIRTKSDGDGISIFGSSNVWIDHVSMSHCTDGLIDAIMGSTAITISNGHYNMHNESFLFGASKKHTQDKLMQITMAFNHFGEGMVQRMPRCRYGFTHVVNNDYTHWIMYAIGGSDSPTILSQGNRFIAPADINAKEVTKRDYAPESVWKNWQWISEGDLMLNGAYFVESGRQTVSTSSYANGGLINAMPGSSVGSLTKYAGPLNCIRGRPC